MAAAAPFIPEFGPNGAVLNAPTMTPSMREKIAAAQKLRRKGSARLGGFIIFGVLAAILVGILTRSAAHSIWPGDLHTAQTAKVAGMAVGAGAWFAFLLAATSRRWQLIGRGSYNFVQLRSPFALRWGLAALDVATICAATASYYVGATTIADRHQRDTVFALFLAAAVCLYFLGLGLRALATARGWEWREQAAAEAPKDARAS